MEEPKVADIQSTLPLPSATLQTLDYKPTARDVLLVSWIGSHFECAASRRGNIVSPLIEHEDCHTSDDFDRFVDGAIDALGYKGSKAELLLDSGILDTSIHTLPPIKQRQQASYIREKIKRSQDNISGIVWESQKIAASKNGQRVLVHSMSKLSFNALEEKFSSRGIDLKKVLPFMGTASRPFRDLQTKSGSSSIILVPIGLSFKILSLDSTGDLQFARDLSRQNSDNPQRVAVEINRCILFARQQFGKPVSQIATVGLKATKLKAVIANVLQSDTPITHRRAPKDLWLTSLASSNALNLAKESMIQDRKLRMRRIMITASTLLVASSLTFYAYHTHSKWQEESSRIDTLRKQSPAMRTAIAEALATQTRSQELNTLITELDSHIRPPIEKALLNFLSNNLSEQTWLTHFAVNWDARDRFWYVQLHFETNGDANQVRERSEELETSLSAPPFRMKVKQQSASRVVAISSNTDTINSFVVEGIITADEI